MFNWKNLIKYCIFLRIWVLFQSLFFLSLLEKAPKIRFDYFLNVVFIWDAVGSSILGIQSMHKCLSTLIKFIFAHCARIFSEIVQYDISWVSGRCQQRTFQLLDSQRNNNLKVLTLKKVWIKCFFNLPGSLSHNTKIVSGIYPLCTQVEVVQ